MNDITFNEAQWNHYNSGALSLEAVAAHEWGHALGLGHTGKHDTPNSSSAEYPPTMATCVDGGSTARASLSRDDEAGITSVNESVSSWETITANSSFEENESSHKEWWTTQNVSSFSALTSGGGVDGSAWYGWFKPTIGVSNGAIYSDTFYTAKNGEQLKGRANYRKNVSSDSGSVKVTLKVRPWDHSGSNCGKLNAKSLAGGWAYQNKTCVPNSSWSYCTTGTIVMSGGQDRVLQARIVLYNNMQSIVDGGTNTYVDTDRTRVMVIGYSL